MTKGKLMLVLSSIFYFYVKLKIYLIMEDYEKRLDFLTPEQIDQILFCKIKNGQINTFLDMVAKGYGLTPFILNALIDFGYEKVIQKALQSSVRLANDCYQFLCVYWGKKKTEDFLVEQKYFNYIKQNFPVVSLVEYQLWDILAQREEFEALAENGQFDVLAAYKQYQLLVNRGQLDYVCHKGLYKFLILTQAGMEKLIQLKKWKEFFVGISLAPYNGFSVSEILEVLWNNGMQKLLFAKCYDEFLLKEKKYTKPYVANKKWGTLAAYGFYDEIDWEDYLGQVIASKKEDVYKEAVEAKNWAFLAKHQQHALLFRNGEFKWWWKSFG